MYQKKNKWSEEGLFLFSLIFLTLLIIIKFTMEKMNGHFTFGFILTSPVTDPCTVLVRDAPIWKFSVDTDIKITHSCDY